MSDLTVRDGQMRPRSWWWISVLVVLPVLGLTAAAALVLVVTTHPVSPGDRIDLARTALSVGAGAGGVVALVLAGRRQWHTEDAERYVRQDATARRVTELYGKTADQLGSDKAAVRLAGLYALERLAQDNPGHRQTAVNVICGYLRMPYEEPGERPAENADDTIILRHRERVQERQVRLTAQRILTHHLNPGSDSLRPAGTFWPDIHLELAGAVLIDFSLQGAWVARASFRDARFIGTAEFSGARFSGTAKLDFGWDGYDLPGSIDFVHADFTGRASFADAEFVGGAEFDGARFAESAGFVRARFSVGAWFRGTVFCGLVMFGEAYLDGAWFARAEFGAGTSFDETRFCGGADFDGVTVASDRGLNRFHGSELPLLRMEEKVFTGNSPWVRLDLPDERPRRWPPGWSVHPTADQPDNNGGRWGRLVEATDDGDDAED